MKFKRPYPWTLQIFCNVFYNSCYVVFFSTWLCLASLMFTWIQIFALASLNFQTLWLIGLVLVSIVHHWPKNFGVQGKLNFISSALLIAWVKLSDFDFIFENSLMVLAIPFFGDFKSILAGRLSCDKQKYLWLSSGVISTGISRYSATTYKPSGRYLLNELINFLKVEYWINGDGMSRNVLK